MKDTNTSASTAAPAVNSHPHIVDTGDTFDAIALVVERCTFLLNIAIDKLDPTSDAYGPIEALIVSTQNELTNMEKSIKKDLYPSHQTIN